MRNVKQNLKLEIWPAVIFVLVLFACSKKDPEITIKAGDMGGSSIHYVNSGIDFYTLQANNLDIDGDHFNDFSFGIDFEHTPASYYISFTVNPINTGQSSYISVDSKGNPLLLKKGDKIDESMNWSKSQNMCLYLYSSSSYPGGSTFSKGNWGNVKDGYLGFKTVSGNKTCYGWMRLDVDSYPHEFYLTDYGYIEY